MKKLMLMLLFVAAPASAQDMTAICEYSVRDPKTQNELSGDRVSIHYEISEAGISNKDKVVLFENDNLKIGVMPKYVGSQRLYYKGKSGLFVFADSTPNLGRVRNEQTHSTLRVEEPEIAKVEFNCSFLQGTL